MSKIIDIASKIGKGLIGGFVDETAGIVDSIGDIVTRKQELNNAANKLINNLAIAMQEAYNEELRIQADTLKAAYDREARINESEHSSWLAKNTLSLLSLTTYYITATLIFIIIFCDYPPDKKETIERSLYIMSALTTMVFGYYYTSSAGSKNKDETITKLTKRLENEKSRESLSETKN